MAQAIDGVQMNASAAELNTLVGVLSGFGVIYYVDGNNGSDTNRDGFSPGQSFATIQNAMDVITARGAERGRSSVLCAAAGYAEAVTTPTNAIAPFGRLIAYNPTPGNTFGAAWIQSPTALTPAIKVLARGWLVQGFKIASVANTEAILLDGVNGTPSGFQLRDCLVSGWAVTGAIGLDVTKNGAPHTQIKNCRFTDFKDSAMICSSSATDQPRFWRIEDCVFVDNAKHINMNPRGFKESVITRCHFIQAGANRTATIQLDNRGGSGCLIGPHNVFSDTYDNTGGYYAGSTEHWRGNYHEDSNGPGNDATGESNPAS